MTYQTRGLTTDELVRELTTDELAVSRGGLTSDYCEADLTLSFVQKTPKVPT